MASLQEIITDAVNWALGIATDNSHGYDQGQRWGKDYDCSSLVISAFEAAGVPVKSKGATYTGNMVRVFCECGFENVINTVNLANGNGLQFGDVLLWHDSKTENGHTAIYIGSGQIVHASANEFGGARGGATGDQTGSEICVRGYYNPSNSWNYVLRYTGTKKETQSVPAPVLVALPELYEGRERCAAVATMQVLINYALRDEQHFNPLEVDGEFGKLTKYALMTVQAKYGLVADAICGQLTWSVLLKGEY